MAAAAVSTSWPEMLAGVVSESNRVVGAHSRHFLALSVLFLLPLSSLLVAAPSLPFLSPESLLHPFRPHPFSPPQSLLRLPSPPNSFSFSAVAFAALFVAVALFLFLSAASAVAGSVHAGFFGRRVSLLPALRSLAGPLARLLLTILAALLPLAALLALLASLLLLVVRALRLLHHVPSSVEPISCSVFAAAAAFGVLHLLVSWSLAGPISILESKFGFYPLRRSTHLVTGMKWAALFLHLFFGVGIGLMLWGFGLRTVEDAGDWTRVVPVVAKTVLGSGITATLLLYSLVTNVVMYMYCKALHGELAGEIVEEFAWEYVCLPFDEEKVPHIVTVVQQ